MNVTRRRAVLATFAIAGFGRPAFAQEPGRLYRVAFLVESDSAARRLDLMLPALARMGYRERSNLQIERRNAEGDPTLIRVYAAELVATRPDVIVVSGARVVAVLREATRTIPLVMASASDPVGLGFARSLSHPGGTSRALRM